MNKLFTMLFVSFIAALSIFTLNIDSIKAGSSTCRNCSFNLPKFGRCPNPGGTQIAGYDIGFHWIPGNGLQWGSDYVYDTGNNTFVQCYCPIFDSQNQPDFKQGVQSNWVRADSLSSDTESLLIRTGWIVIENGADFGLPEGRYLVNNIPYWCRSPQCKPFCSEQVESNSNFRLSTKNGIQNNFSATLNNGSFSVEGFSWKQ
jgi:hypothetical protein